MHGSIKEAAARAFILAHDEPELPDCEGAILYVFRVTERHIVHPTPPTADDVVGMIAEYSSHVVDVDTRNLRRLLLLTGATLDVVDEWLAAATPEQQKDQIYQSLRDTAQELRQEVDGWKE